MSKNIELNEALRNILVNRSAGSQTAICDLLASEGHPVTQTKVSRLLIKLNAYKVKNSDGQLVYTVNREPAPLATDSPLSQLIVEIVANEQMVIVHTSPGAASLVARLLDHQDQNSCILGTIAGDDTIFVAPKSVQQTDKLLREVRALL